MRCVRRYWRAIGRPLALGLCVACGSFAAWAEEPSQAARTSATAMPGFAHLSLPEVGSMAVAADAGYGYTQALADDDATHHRAAGSLAFAMHPTNWLGVGVRFDGRYDKHPADAQGADDSFTGVPSLRLRAFDKTTSLSYGAEIVSHFPGADAPSVELSATTVDLKALVAYQTDNSPLLVAANLGMRLDKSDAAAPDLTTLRRGDRAALGLSEYNAVLAGVGAGWQMQNGLLMVDLSLQAFTHAGTFAQSPQRVAIGYRHQLTPSLEAETFFRFNINDQPAVTPEAPVLPVEPRAGGWVGLRMSFGRADTPVEREPHVAPDDAPKTPPPKEEEEEEEVAATSAPVTGVVVDSDGAPLPQVEMHLSVEGYAETVLTDAEGKYRFESVPFGKGALRAETVDYDPVGLELEVVGDGSPVRAPEVRMKLQALVAQVQGLVQTFDGKPVAAAITIAPPGKTYKASADGRFSIDVEPGEYTLRISAPGYAAQSHVVTVGEKAVVVVNADLRKAQ